MTERPTYEELLAILEPVYLGVCAAIQDANTMQRQWGKERRAHLESHGWTEEEFYKLVDAERKRRFNEVDPPQPLTTLPRAGVPLPVPTRTNGPSRAQDTSCQGVGKVEAWFNLHKYKGQRVTYSSRNRRHTFVWGEGYEVTITCYDERTGKQYWSCAVSVGPNTRVVDAVRNARVGAQS